jgi:hypothetical protein
MRAILIDPDQRVLQEIKLDVDVNSQDKLSIFRIQIGCRFVSSLKKNLPWGDRLYVDKEGFKNPLNLGFTIGGNIHAYGRGIVIGLNEQGLETNCRIDSVRLKRYVDLLNTDETYKLRKSRGDIMQQI